MPGHQNTVLDLVHRTCHEYAATNTVVKVDQAALQRLAQTVDAAAVCAVAEESTTFPVKFDDLESEVTFLALFHLLDFGSGFDGDLMAVNQRDAHECVQFGVLGMHLGSARMDARWMREFSSFSVHNMFGIEGTVEEEVMPGVRLSKPGPLAPLVAALRGAINQAGAALDKAGADSLGRLILRHLDREVDRGAPPTAASLVSELVGTVPGFADVAPTPRGGEAGGESGGAAEVALHRKAQLLAAALARRFGAGGEEGRRFGFNDLGELAGDSGALVAAVLRHKGVLAYAEPLASTVDSDTPLPAGAQEAAIRACAVAALDALADALQQRCTPHQLGCWLRGLVEEGRELAGVGLHPHITRDTLAY